jgi:hypothetical protein
LLSPSHFVLVVQLLVLLSLSFAFSTTIVQQIVVVHAFSSCTILLTIVVEIIRVLLVFVLVVTQKNVVWSEPKGLKRW